jgi:glycosyltransferase involved in cell wall biosynthesis
MAEELDELGVKCSLESRDSRLGFFAFALRIPFHEGIVFQKTYSRWHCLLLHWAKWLGKKTLLDLDDAPSRTNNPVTLRNVEFMMRNVTAVSVGSRVLSEYAAQFSDQVHLIPSSIRLKHYVRQSESGEKPSVVTLGWIGNGKHYKQDLVTILKEPLTEVAKKYPVRFRLIGACHQQELYEAFAGIPGLELDFIDQIEWSDPAAVVAALQPVDIGLYPLLPGGSNEFKCGFKALEYMAMQIPTISSDVSENRMIIKHGETGYFATTREEWAGAISELVEQKEKLLEMGLSGRKSVEQSYATHQAAATVKRLLSDDA